jgi:hypothetical protein
MDERELETRLRDRLHRRFDGAQPGAALRATVQAVTAEPVSVIRSPIRLAWLAAAALVIALVAGLGIGGWAGPGGLIGTPEPTASPGVETRQYIVLPPAGSIPSKASTSIASDTLDLRLRSIGSGTFSSAAGDAITFQLPPDFDVDDALIRAVLSATGELSFVPLPPEDYGSGEHVAVIGEPLPVDEPELFGQEQIEGAGVATNNGVPVRVHFGLTPIGAAALEVYTSGHIGETFAILVDGKVALLPVVQAAITGGTLEVSGSDPSELALLAAIVTSGTLPEEWREPRVPVVIPESEARALAIAAAASPDAVAVRTELSTFGDPRAGEEVVAAWLVDLTGTLPDAGCTTSPFQTPLPPPCPAVSTGHAVIDAVSGELLDSTFR